MPLASASPLAAAATDADPAAGVPHPRLKAVIVRLAHSLLVACVAPAVLFSVCLLVLDVWMALVAALVWCYGVMAWRLLTGRRGSGLILLTAMVLTTRTIVAFASGSTFVYFLQPIVSDGIIAAVFLLSLATSTPVVARLAADFYPMTDDVAARPRVQRLFWHLTLLWALMSLTKAGATWWLLSSQSLVSFVLLKNLVMLGTTVAAVAVTVAVSVRVARVEGLLRAA